MTADRRLREEMLEELHSIATPIVAYAAIHDMGCDFVVLTKDGGADALGANWPVVGPLTITEAQHAALHDLFLNQSIDEDEGEEVIAESELSEPLRAEILHLLHILGEERLQAIVRAGWPPETPFFLFKDERDDQPPKLFATRAEAAVYFGEVYAGSDRKAWNSMKNDELLEWCEWLRQWREKGSPELPALPTRYHG